MIVPVMAVVLFCNHDSDHCDEYRKYSGSFCKNLSGSIWISTGGSRWFWGSTDEWSQKRTYFPMRQALVLLHVRQLQQNVISRSKQGLVQALGVFIDTIVICSCTAMIMLLAPEEKVAGLSGMDLLQTAMEHHLGRFGVVFIAATLFLFSFSTFLGILFYARSNVAYLFGDNWISQTAYKVS